jgi:4-coumarate--CoA ligase
MTETSTTITQFPITQHIGVFGSAGVLLPGFKARVEKPDGSLAKVGEVGELIVTGPTLALRYQNNEDAYELNSKLTLPF